GLGLLSCPRPPRPAARRGSVLGLQLALVLADEGADLVRHVEKPAPLFLVERHREAAEPVHRHPALVAHPQVTAALRAGFQGFVLGPKAGYLAFEMLLARAPSIDTPCRRSLPVTPHRLPRGTRMRLPAARIGGPSRLHPMRR